MSREKWTSEKIFTRLLNNKTQKTYWENVSELRKRPNQDVYKKAYELAKSDIDNQKIIGLDILQQLGFHPRFNKKQTVELHFELLKEIQSDKVLKSIFHGIGHNNDELNEKQISKLVEFKTIKNTDIKHALISALSGLENSNAINTLIEFTEHKTSTIRNWATFGIGTLIESDNREIRNALWKRIDDTDFETKSEAIVGLANRKDEKIKGVIKSELKNGDYGTLLFEAILTLDDKDFLPLLIENLEIVKKDKNDIANGWVLALEGTISELKK
ncbi:hypothetical protein [Nonlabens sp. Asnod3-A02]|uniref:hypothetical protein n=1 Tax=Nonlabens sp. Asnod3-A02 TaxID=3160579 RepID=UPI0038677F2B